MNRPAFINMLIWVFLFGTFMGAWAEAQTRSSAGFIAVTVNGRKLRGPNSTAQSRGGRLHVPVAAIARSLGDRLEVSGRTLRLDRQDGVAAAFDAGSGQVLENGVSVLSISDGAQLVFAATADETMLPVEIASVLFNAAIRYDSVKDTVVVTRGVTMPVVSTAKTRRSAELYRADYELNASGYSGSVAQNLTVNAAGRVGDARVFARAASSGTAFGRVALRNFTVEAERPNGQQFAAGDLATGMSLPMLASQIRGASAVARIGKAVVTAFGGRARSGTFIPLSVDIENEPEQLLPARFNGFDTNVYGVNAARNVSRFGLAAGLMRFDGRSRGGDVGSASITFTGSKLRSQADLAVGKFRGSSPSSDDSAGAFALDFLSSYQVSPGLAVHARFTEIGRGFLMPQAGVREPLSLRAGGVTYSPVPWLTAAVNASTTRRPGDTGRAESFITAAVGISPGGQKPRVYISHTASSSRLHRSGAFTLINASKEFHRWRLFMNATRIRTIGPANFNVQAGGNFSLSDRHSLEATQGFGRHTSLNGMLDWRMSQLAGGRMSLSAGAGYNYSPSSRLNVYQRFTASLRLPRETSIQASYMNTVTGPAMLVQLRGSIFKRREAAAFLGAPVAEVNKLSSVAGRVYQDNDGDGSYDPSVDTARSDVKVRLDGSRYVVTDANGNFSFDAVPAGTHSVYLDLLSVRADLTLIDGAAREVELTGGHTAGLDFRLVRTGRAAGRVFFDENGNGIFDDSESPLADVRIVTAGGRDTLTDADGYYVIADLAPGEHVIFIDEKTLPAKTVAASRSVSMNVFAGKETEGVALAVASAPAEVKRFGKRD